MTNGKDQHQEDLVLDLVDDSVLPGAYAPLVVATQELLGPSGRGSSARSSTAA